MKVVRFEEENVEYSKEHWELLETLRRNAQVITTVFHNIGFETLTYGSVARGDVNPKSDIDIILMNRIPSYRLELILEDAHIQILNKKIIQATPNDIIKVHYELANEICLTLPLTNFTSMPFEFYYFGGALTHQNFVENTRKPGVDKRLMLILPTETGHRATPLIEKRYEAAKIIGVSQQMIEQRIRVLTRRDKIGRTGVFLNEELSLSDNVEEVLKSLAMKNRLIRKRLNL